MVDGWIATTYLAGAEEPDRWAEVIDASGLFHSALVGSSCPDFLAVRTHRWALADRIAWGEAARALRPVRQRAVPRHRATHGH